MFFYYSLNIFCCGSMTLSFKNIAFELKIMIHANLELGS